MNRTILNTFLDGFLSALSLVEIFSMRVLVNEIYLELKSLKYDSYEELSVCKGKKDIFLTVTL